MVGAGGKHSRLRRFLFLGGQEVQNLVSELRPRSFLFQNDMVVALERNETGARDRGCHESPLVESDGDVAAAKPASAPRFAEKFVTTDTRMPASASPLTVSSKRGCSKGSPPESLTSQSPGREAKARTNRGTSSAQRLRSSRNRCVQYEQR